MPDHQTNPPLAADVRAVVVAVLVGYIALTRHGVQPVRRPLEEVGAWSRR